MASDLVSRLRSAASVRTPKCPLGDDLDAAADRIEQLEADLRKANRTATDRAYMIDALSQMLGPKGREVWARWQEQGLQRIHTSWVIDPAEIDGETVAQHHLDTEEAMKTAVRIDDVDSHLDALRSQGKGEG